LNNSIHFIFKFFQITAKILQKCSHCLRECLTNPIKRINIECPSGLALKKWLKINNMSSRHEGKKNDGEIHDGKNISYTKIKN
jgi:hypothetical protein